MQKKLLIVITAIFIQISCSSSKSKIEEQEILVVNNDNLKLSVKQFERLTQDIFDLNQLDFLFTDEDQKEGLTVVINEFIRPFYNKMNLTKFNKPVKFLYHKEIYDEENEKFMDFLGGSIFVDNDTLNIIVGLRYSYTAIHARFIKKGNGWKVLNKNFENANTYLPKYNYKKDKELCLAEQIKHIKTKNINIPSCLKFDFSN